MEQENKKGTMFTMQPLLSLTETVPVSSETTSPLVPLGESGMFDVTITGAPVFRTSSFSADLRLANNLALPVSVELNVLQRLLSLTEL